MPQTPTVLAGKKGILTVNGNVAKIVGWNVRVSNDVIKYATTSQTADNDGNFWMSKLAGMNDAVIDIEGWWTSEAVAADKFTGTNYLFRPGTATAGSLVCSFQTGDAFTATGVVGNFEGGINVESNKPSTFRAVFEVSGSITWPT